MGEVYRARDTRLSRIVAVKALSAPLTRSADSRDRFEGEAHLVASLNHPHICTLHDVGRDGDIDYLVMEYLEGETLSSRLGAGPLPLALTLEYGIQIADALDKAHRSFGGPSGARRPRVGQWWCQSAVGIGRQALVLPWVGLQTDGDDTHVRERCSRQHADAAVSSAPHLGLVAVVRRKEIPVSRARAAAGPAHYSGAELAAADQPVSVTLRSQSLIAGSEQRETEDVRSGYLTAGQTSPARPPIGIRPT